VTIAYATIQGMLRVTQREDFVKSFTKGIGRARAFGCGLLQLVPTA
jgi:CRISPR system Cascade subunit CasE